MSDERFGPYQLLGLLGRGGMGEVHRALDLRKDRVVALKVLPADLVGDPEFATRFRRESESAARLNAPHVIPIHDYGEVDGRLFLDMRLVDGIDLASLLVTNGPLPPARAVDLVAQTANALTAAHAAGLVHRDVKPSNILVVDNAGADFVYLIDFGIVRDRSKATLTSTGIVGTPAYMAPERFTSEGPPEPALDVYSLACVLHEALTGSRPFPGDGFRLMQAHVHEPPPRASAVRAGVPVAFDAVVAAGMAKDPRARTPSASALAEHARAALRDATRVGPGGPMSGPDSSESGTPPPPTPTDGAGASGSGGAEVVTARRRRRVAIAVGALVVVGALGIGVGVGLSPSTESSAPPGPSPPGVVAPGATAPPVIGRVPVGTGPSGAVVVRGGQIVYVTNTSDGTVSAVDTAAQRVIATIPVGMQPTDLAVSPDGGTVFVANTRGGVSLLDVSRRQVLATFPAANPQGVALAGRRLLVTEYGTGRLQLLDAGTGTTTGSVSVGAGALAVTVSADERRAYVVNAQSDEVLVVDLRALAVTARVPVGGGASAVATSPDGSRVYVTSSETGQTIVLDGSTDAVVGRVATPQGYGLAVSADGSRAYVAGRRGLLYVLDARSLRITSTVPIGPGAYGMALSDDGTRAFVTSSTTNSITVLDTS